MQTAPLDFRLATRADEELLIALMRDFYAEDKIEFDDARVRRGVDALLADPRNGEVLLWLDEAYLQYSEQPRARVRVVRRWPVPACHGHGHARGG